MFCHLVALCQPTDIIIWCPQQPNRCSVPTPFNRVLSWPLKPVTMASRGRPKHSLTHSLTHRCLFYRVTLLSLRLFNDVVTCKKLQPQPDISNAELQCMWPIVRRCRGTGGKQQMWAELGRVSELGLLNAFTVRYHLQYDITKWHYNISLTVYHWQCITYNISLTVRYHWQYVTIYH
jgi:hypothetical protein